MLKELIRTFLSRIIVGVGLASMGRMLFPKNGALILYGHRVQDDDEGDLQGLRPSWFDEQLAYLSQHYEFLSLSRLINCYEERQPIPPNSVIITFDDGFRDNFTNAYPLLQRYHVPATVFLVTGCVSSGELPWPQKLGYIFQHTNVEILRHKTTGGSSLGLRSNQERKLAKQLVKNALGQLSRVSREQSLNELSEALEVDVPRDRMLTWEQIETMRKGGVEFGAHTVSHPWMALLPQEEARWEMEESLREFQNHLGISRPFFVFPSGSYTPELVEMAISVGFRCVFQSRHSIRINNLEETDQFSLSRVGLPNAPAIILEAELDGPLHALRRLYRS